MHHLRYLKNALNEDTFSPIKAREFLDIEELFDLITSKNYIVLTIHGISPKGTEEQVEYFLPKNPTSQEQIDNLLISKLNKKLIDTKQNKNYIGYEINTTGKNGSLKTYNLRALKPTQ